MGATVGISRTMVSYWEAGQRLPNDWQLIALARLYGCTVADLLRGGHAEAEDADPAGMLLRADGAVDPGSILGIREFVQFLDRYAVLSEVTGILIHGLT